jgi:hypothetical protein
MTTAQAPVNHHAAPIDSLRASTPPATHHADLEALLAENKQLRELVVKLSEILIRNVLDRSPPTSPPVRARKG